MNAARWIHSLGWHALYPPSHRKQRGHEGACGTQRIITTGDHVWWRQTYTANGGTTWHTMLLFGERAERLKEKPIATGHEIEIVGYPHERSRRSRLEGSRQVTELYATAIRTTLKAPPIEPPASPAGLAGD
jgi:hypothetical protein